MDLQSLHQPYRGGQGLQHIPSSAPSVDSLPTSSFLESQDILSQYSQQPRPVSIPAPVSRHSTSAPGIPPMTPLEQNEFDDDEGDMNQMPAFDNFQDDDMSIDENDSQRRLSHESSQKGVASLQHQLFPGRESKDSVSSPPKMVLFDSQPSNLSLPSDLSIEGDNMKIFEVIGTQETALSDDRYFDSQRLSQICPNMWAGASHWRFGRPKRITMKNSSQLSQENTQSSTQTEGKAKRSS